MTRHHRAKPGFTRRGEPDLGWRAVGPRGRLSNRERALTLGSARDLERETRFELATLCMEKRSTPPNAENALFTGDFAGSRTLHDSETEGRIKHVLPAWTQRNQFGS